MSCYEWEAGEIRLPKKDYPKFRKSIIEAWNKYHLDLYQRALIILLKLKKMGKGKRKFDWHGAYVDNFCEGPDEAFFAIEQMIFDFKALNGPKLIRPKKKDVPKAKVSKGTKLALGEARIAFNDKTCTVTWAVPENNHACEYAREHPVAVKLFNALARVKWTRGSGGQIVGNDEYNREDCHAGGGGNYVKETYNQKGAF